MKRLLFTNILLFFSSLTQAQQTLTENDVFVENGEILHVNIIYNQDIIIPETIFGVTITSIGPDAFSN